MKTTMLQNIEKITEITGLKHLDSYQQLHSLGVYYGVKPSVAGLGVSFMIIILVIFSVAGSLIMAIVGFLIPALFTLRAITLKGQEDVKYLTYWVMYALTEVATPLITLLIPEAYWLSLRTMIVILLLHPKFEGAKTLYSQVIEPNLYKI